MLAIAFGVRAQRLRTHNRRMRVALDNMSQGLCMFGRNERLVVCNQRYKEMYHLPDDVARPGMTLTGLLEYRASTGTFSRKVEDYRRELLASMEGGRIRSTEIKSADGRAIFVTNRPMADGGWVATHEDITDRRGAERERASMQEQQERRAVIEQAILSFRQRIEELLHTVTEGAMTMRSTASTLFANSGQTSKSAESAVTASNDASTNVDTAAVAADELAGSIGEIGRQLDLDHRHRARGGGRGARHQRADHRVGAGGAEDRRRGQADPRHRRTDQSAGAQRHHRGGARRRSRQGLCGGGLGSQIAGGADRESDRATSRI